MVSFTSIVTRCWRVCRRKVSSINYVTYLGTISLGFGFTCNIFRRRLCSVVFLRRGAIKDKLGRRDGAADVPNCVPTNKVSCLLLPRSRKCFNSIDGIVFVFRTSWWPFDGPNFFYSALWMKSFPVNTVGTAILFICRQFNRFTFHSCWNNIGTASR